MRTGTWLADLAHLDAPGHPNPTGLSLHGVDLGSTLFRRDSRLDLREHNLKYKFPESWNWSNSFDLVHQRLLVWGIRSEEWEAVLDHLVDVVKPGGYIQLVEAEWVLPSYSEEQPQQRKLGLVQSWSTESAGMDVHIWKRLPSLLKARGLTTIREESFNLGYGATATREQDRVWTAELLPQSFRHLARRIPSKSSACIDNGSADRSFVECGIPGVAADAEEYMSFLEQLVDEMKSVGYNPQLRWLTAQKPAASE